MSVTAGVPNGLANISGGANGTFLDETEVLNLQAATPVADGPGVQWRFANWTGDVLTPPNGSNPVSVTMNQARSITANYIKQYSCPHWPLRPACRMGPISRAAPMAPSTTLAPT